MRVQSLRTRLSGVEQQLESGRVRVCRGGKDLLRKRCNLADAGLTETQWRERWEASRLFLTGDGEKDKAWGNETIRWNPDQNWLEIRLPTPLARLANRPSSRYRLSCPVAFTYRAGDVAAQAATGKTARGRWYLDASWKTPPAAPLPLAAAGRAASSRWTSTPGTSRWRWRTATATRPVSVHHRLALAGLASDRDGGANTPAAGPPRRGAGMAARTGIAVIAVDRPTPPAGARSTGSPRCASITPNSPVTTRQRW